MRDAQNTGNGGGGDVGEGPQLSAAGSMARRFGSERAEIAGRDTSDMGLTRDIYNAGNIFAKEIDKYSNTISYLCQPLATGQFDLS
jgi:hypothetical protein